MFMVILSGYVGTKTSMNFYPRDALECWLNENKVVMK